jgi:hypothetical protein
MDESATGGCGSRKERTAITAKHSRSHVGVCGTSLLWLWASPWPNGCLQQIAARRFTMTQDDDAILLQGFVSPFSTTEES